MEPLNLKKDSHDDMRVAVIIVTMSLESCRKLVMFLKQDPRAFIVLVLNGCSADHVVKLQNLVGDSGHCIVLPENVGGSGGFRAGMQYVMDSGCPDSQRVWLLDDDAEINDKTLTELLNGADQLDREGIRWGAIGSMMADAGHRSRVVETGAFVNWKKGGFLQLNSGKLISDISPKLLPVQYCAAASLLTRAEVLRQVGIFANIFIHFDDVDWCIRLGKAGYAVYCNPASFFHHPTGLGKPVTWVRYYDAANFIWLCTKYRKRQIPAAILLQLCKCLYFNLHGFTKTGKLYWEGIRDGLRGENRKLRKDLVVEKYCDAAPEVWPETRLFISNSLRNIVKFRRRFPVGTRFYYLGNRRIKRMIRGTCLQILLVFTRERNIIIDDYFRYYSYLPVFFHHCDYYNVSLNQKVML